MLYFYPGDSLVPGFNAHSFDIVQLTTIASQTSYYGRNVQWWIFILFFIGFSSRCRRSRSTPGCPTPTSRRRRRSA